MATKERRIYPRISREMHSRICIVAELKGVNQSEVVRLALEPFLAAELDQRKAENPAA